MTAPNPVSLGVKLGFLAFAIGGIAALFTGEWRWLVVGLAALLVAAVVSAPTKRSDQ